MANCDNCGANDWIINDLDDIQLLEDGTVKITRAQWECLNCGTEFDKGA